MVDYDDNGFSSIFTWFPGLYTRVPAKPRMNTYPSKLTEWLAEQAKDGSCRQVAAIVKMPRFCYLNEFKGILAPTVALHGPVQTF